MRMDGTDAGRCFHDLVPWAELRTKRRARAMGLYMTRQVHGEQVRVCNDENGKQPWDYTRTHSGCLPGKNERRSAFRNASGYFGC
jgi:hypothetical protein